MLLLGLVEAPGPIGFSDNCLRGMSYAVELPADDPADVDFNPSNRNKGSRHSKVSI